MEDKPFVLQSADRGKLKGQLAVLPPARDKKKSVVVEKGTKMIGLGKKRAKELSKLGLEVVRRAGGSISRGGKKVVENTPKIGGGIAKDMKGAARDVVEASKKIPGAVRRGAKATVKGIKDDVEFFAPMGDVIKDSLVETYGDLEKVSRKGIEAGKNTINIMGEGHARSMNPEHGQPLDERPLPEVPKRYGRGTLGKRISEKVNSPEFVSHLRAGLGTRPEDDALIRAQEREREIPLEDAEISADTKPKKRGQGIKKLGQRGLKTAGEAISMMGKGHARSMNPEHGKPLDERPQSEIQRQRGPSLRERLSKILTRKGTVMQDFDLENKTIDELETIRAQVTNELLPGIANGEVHAILVETQSEIDRLIKEKEGKDKRPESIEDLLILSLEDKTIPELEEIKLKVGQAFMPGMDSEMANTLGEMLGEIDALITQKKEVEKENIKIETPPNKSGTLPESEQKILEEIKELPKAEREKLGFGIHRMGFSFEQHKNQFFAGVFRYFSKTNLDQNKTTTRWMKKLADNFEKNADIAHKKAKEDKEGTHKRQIVNAISLGSNVIKWGRVISDLSHRSLASPLRYVMMAGMAFTGAAEAAKEVRFENEELIDKTRIADAERAAEEAWKIYQRAQEKINDSSGVNMQAEALKDAYLMEMPADLKKRLENPGVANGMVQAIVKKDLKFTVDRLNKSLDKIDADTKLNVQEKNTKKEKLLKKWEKNLEDYDRLVTQYGTVDGLALAGMYAQTAGKTVVAAVTLETIILSVEKLFGSLAHTQTAVEAHQAGRHINTIPGMEKADATAVVSAGKETIAPFPQGLGEVAKGTVGAEHLEHLGHSLDHTADFQIGKEPGALEHAYEKLTLDHNLPVKLPDGVALDQDGATRALNEAANLVRLTQGHGVADISVAQFNDAVKFEGGVLHITDPAKWNNILDRLHHHSSELLAKGIFKDPDGATGYIKHVDWLEKVQAKDIHAIYSDIGHPDATASQIADFSHIPSAPEAGVVEAHAKVMDAFHGQVVEQVKAPVDTVQTPVVKTLSPEHVLGQSADQSAPVVHAPFTPHAGTYNQFNLPGEMMTRVNTIYEHNISHLFPTDTKEAWAGLSRDSADKYLAMKDGTGEEGIPQFVAFMHKIRDIAGRDCLPPRAETVLQPAETNKEYFQRVLEFIAAKKPDRLPEATP